MDDEIAELRFNGLRYGWWQNTDISMSVDDLCASVDLSLTRPGNGDPLGIDENTVADVLVGGAAVTVVRPDLCRRRTGAKHHSVVFKGRSLARELVDCQYSITLSGLTLGEIVKRLCSTFKVPVKIDAKTQVVPSFSMQCEIPANALINAVRASNLLLYPLPSGGLILTYPTDAPPVATLQKGVNIVEIDVVDEYKLRYSHYVVKGYDYDSNEAMKGSSKDEDFSFFRPYHIVADRHGQGLGGCDRRALLERDRRKARAHRIEIMADGWGYLDADNTWNPWEINTQVRVIDDEEGIDGVFLIGDVHFQENDKVGKKTHLTVMSRKAFLGEPSVKKSKRGAGITGAKK